MSLSGKPGLLNAITDVPGVEVGEITLIEGDGPLRVGSGPVRTGVTAILPRGRSGVGQPCAAGWYSLNGNGEMTGTTWIEESGAFNLPIVLSNTHAVGACHTGVTAWVNKVDPQLARQWLLPVCAETWDGYLNDINGAHVRPEHAEAALDAAAPGPVAEGSVGGGHGDELLRVQGWQWHRLASGGVRLARLHRRGLRAGELRLATRVDGGGSTRRSRTRRRQPTGLGLVRSRSRAAAAAWRRLGDRRRRHRRSATARPVQGPGSPGAAWPGQDRHHGQPFLR